MSSLALGEKITFFAIRFSVTFDQISQIRSKNLMEILVIGTEAQATECRQKFGGAHIIQGVARLAQAGAILKTAAVVFDFTGAGEPDHLTKYQAIPGTPLFLDTTLVRLADRLAHAGELDNAVFGFCGLHTFVNREILEVAIQNEADRPALEAICLTLGTDYRIVADQAGMVTPRVICMIINEAYYTLEEGTATREDIDLAMKLGTNYPWGPFEWGERIGLENVVRVLTASGEETRDSRYQVCALLNKAAQRI